ncbi:IclR family transcriptional regulator [Phenylobacterium sp.]|uniref:IclR family transcriptional regulator n=1 Tax=Phenylobacterium sp. TaxID=1871053 RepID=UPI0035AF26CB
MSDKPGRDPAGAWSPTTGTVSRALRLLAVVAEAGGVISVKQVAEEMQLPPSTAHRLLQLLKKEGFVEGHPEDRKYSIGPQFYRVAARIVNQVTPGELADPLLADLARAYDETALFGLCSPSQDNFSWIRRADGTQRLQYQIELRRPQSLIWGGSGRSILAHLPLDRVKALLASEGPSPGSGAAPPSLKVLLAQLSEIRARGYAISEGERFPESRGISAAVFSAVGVVGTICLTSPMSRPLVAPLAEIGPAVARTAEELSSLLGARSLA